MPRSTLAGKKEKDALSELTNKKRRKRASVGRDSWMGETSEGDSYVGSSVDETLAINAMDSAFGVLETMGEFGDKIGEAADVLPVTFGEAGINAVKNNLIGMTQSMLQSTGRKKEEGTVGKVISNAQKVVKQREYVVGENEFYSGGLGDAYGELATSCDNYINSHNPWTAVGKQRLAIVKAVRAQSKWERKMVLDHKQELAAEENKGKTFTEFIINCGEDVINKGLLDSRRDFNRKDIKTMPDWMLKEQVPHFGHITPLLTDNVIWNIAMNRIFLAPFSFNFLITCHAVAAVVN